MAQCPSSKYAPEGQIYTMRGPRLLDHTDWKSKKSLHVLRCSVFTVNIGIVKSKNEGIHVLRCSVFTVNIGIVKSKNEGIHVLRCSVFH